MPNDVTKVAVGKPKATGGAYVAPVGTALPTTEASALNAAFKLTGYVSDAGLVEHIGNNTSDIVAWGGDTVRKLQTSQDVTYDLTMIETNATSQGVFYGASNVTTTAATVSAGEKLAVKLTAAELPISEWVFELKDGARTGRKVLPLAQVSSRGDVSYVDNSAVAYPITLTAYPDSTGVKAYTYWDDGVFAAA